jgi:hypothetical protein
MPARRALGMAELAGRDGQVKGPACRTVRTGRSSRRQGAFSVHLQREQITFQDSQRPPVHVCPASPPLAIL